MNIKKIRIDVLLAERGLCQTREKAKRALMAGQVRINGTVISKSSFMADPTSQILVEQSKGFVSRGGEKLAGALTGFDINVEGLTAADIGASTGGFTDCLLKSGAKKVFAVDVGYGLIDWSLRNDPRVVVIERKNARYLKYEDIAEYVDIAVIDVSFISLKKVIPAVLPVLKAGGETLALIKPQFEAGPRDVGKGGVVRSQEVRLRVIDEIRVFGRELGLIEKGVKESVLKGPAGNIEYFIYFKK